MLDSEISPPAGVSAQTLAAVRGTVREVLARSDAFHALPPETQREIAANTVRVIAALATPDGARSVAPPTGTDAAAPAERLLRQVSFPAFVGDLIRGVFQAIVQSSIQQMQSYAELIASVSKSIDEFADKVRSDGEPCPGEEADEKQSASTQTLAGDRQQQLATMVLMGINRIMEEDTPPSGETTEGASQPASDAELNFKSDYLPLER